MLAGKRICCFSHRHPSPASPHLTGVEWTERVKPSALCPQDFLHKKRNLHCSPCVCITSFLLPVSGKGLESRKGRWGVTLLLCGISQSAVVAWQSLPLLQYPPACCFHGDPKTSQSCCYMLGSPEATTAVDEGGHEEGECCQLPPCCVFLLACHHSLIYSGKA